MKLMTFIGTRPEIIRLSRVIPLLDVFCNHILVHTGQNYDYELNEIFFSDLELRKPDYFLDVNTNTLGSFFGDLLSKSESLLIKEKPDGILILGDTNSSLVAIIAKRLRIPIFHMEAGNRCFDSNVPEEINRKIIDHISDFNLVYTEHARRNLIREGIHPRYIYLTGSPLYEVLEHYKEKIQSSNILDELSLQKKEYFLVSIHREENIDNVDNFTKIIAILNSIANKYPMPIIVSTHPRTRKKLNVSSFYLDPNIAFLKPFSFTKYVKLQKESYCVISDSGTISEESSILNFSAINLREATERPEAMDFGNIVLTGLNKDAVLDAVKVTVSNENSKANSVPPLEYKVTNTSWRVLKLVLGLNTLHRKWIGIND